MSASIEVFALTVAYNEDPFDKKVNLGVGAYRTDEGKSYVLPVVRKVEAALGQDATLLHEYLPVLGSPEYRKGAIKLLFGDNEDVISRAGGAQALGGTGALRIGLDFIRTRLNIDTIYLSKPTWGNHRGICKALLFPRVREYRYWDEKNRCLDIQNMLVDLKSASENSAIILHACAHNPTGMDPTMEQWRMIAEVLKEKKMFVFFDIAYQGFSSGSVDVDASAVRLFADMGFELFVAQSFSKNFGLYNERVGQLTYLANMPEVLSKISSNLSTIIRETWSNPPSHGGLVVSTILNDPELFQEWKKTVKSMAERIQCMRQLLFDNLEALGTPGTWDHIVTQTGMFSFTGLTAVQVEYLIEMHHIYLMKDGRINMCAVTTKNVEYVARCIHDTVIKFQGN